MPVIDEREGGPDQDAWDLLQTALTRPIALYPAFIRISGSLTAGVFLAQAFYWTQPGRYKSKTEGWFYKKQSDWERETCLTRYEQETARKLLRARGLIEEKLAGLPATLHYRVNKAALLNALRTLSQEGESASMRKSPKQDGGDSPNRTGAEPQTYISESSSETSPENLNLIDGAAPPSPQDRLESKTSALKAESESSASLSPKQEAPVGSQTPSKVPRKVSPRAAAEKPAPDLRAQHPAIQAVRDLISCYPKKLLWDDIISLIGDEPDRARLKRCAVEWAGRGFNLLNLGWLWDWFLNGIPERNGNGQNGVDGRRPQTNYEQNMRNLQSAFGKIRAAGGLGALRRS